MIKSLKTFLKNSVSVKPFQSRDGAGDASYGTEQILKCYVVSKITTVVNAQGKEVISNIQTYLDGEDSFVAGITDNDLFILNDKSYSVKTISDFYDRGVLSLRVVYI